MANLRTYFGKFDSVSQNAIDSGEVDINYQYSGSVITLMPHCQDTPHCCDNRGGEFMTWCVPTGITSATMHIWGGGGSGAGGRCCQQGVPGGSGAFAKVELTVAQGDCYELCAGFGGLCTASCRGERGCCSFIVGPGLTNFIAEGGYGGKTCCFIYWNNANTHTQCPFWYIDNCDKAQFSGADEGAEGVLGYAFSATDTNQNNCCWKQAIPYPGGIVNKKGGTTVIRNLGNSCNNAALKCNVMPGFGSTSGSRAVGVGAASSTSCDGGCCCGDHGGPGMVKITYR